MSLGDFSEFKQLMLSVKKAKWRGYFWQPGDMWHIISKEMKLFLFSNLKENKYIEQSYDFFAM